MTLDEAIAREKQLEKEQRSHIGTWYDEYSKKCEVYAEEHEQIANWLEELKSNRIALEKANGYLEVNHRLGYNKAIDDAKSVILQTLDNEILVDTLHLRLEQLKAGGKSED